MKGKYAPLTASTQTSAKRVISNDATIEDWEDFVAALGLPVSSLLETPASVITLSEVFV